MNSQDVVKEIAFTSLNRLFHRRKYKRLLREYAEYLKRHYMNPSKKNRVCIEVSELELNILRRSGLYTR